MNVTIITDGSADNKTRSGGWCAIVRTPSSLVEVVGWEDDTTSNRMELMAAIEGLRAIPTPSEVTVVTDSAYLLNTMRNKWYERWINDEPHRTKPRPNMDLWHQLIGLSHFHDVTWIKVKGHSGDYWNERADKLADMARRDKVANRAENAGWVEGVRCASVALSGRQCKLHQAHSGAHYYTNGSANGVAPYGEMAGRDSAAV